MDANQKPQNSLLLQSLNGVDHQAAEIGGIFTEIRVNSRHSREANCIDTGLV